VFTGDAYAEGAGPILSTLKKSNTKASFFFTGRFYRNRTFKNLISNLKNAGHYLGAHSNEHVLYCDWEKRDSLLVRRDSFNADLKRNYLEMRRFGISKANAHYFLPPYEWFNDSIAQWTRDLGLELINYSPGTISHADYTTLSDNNYRSSEEIFQSIVQYEAKNPSGLNGFILLLHIGGGPNRQDKFYDRLPELISWLKGEGYEFERIDRLLQEKK
jgi:peptidoglycan/xylan/chitin deacetylase (PgdA/CDA1 family)